MDVLVLLQNAYYRQGEYKERKQWLLDLNNSTTGIRLAEMLPIGLDYYITNASPLIGDHPDSYFDADINHLIAEITKVRPKLILACGECAQKGVAKITTPIKIIATYHPAYRRLTKKITRKVRQEIITTLHEIYNETATENFFYLPQYNVTELIENNICIIK